MAGLVRFLLQDTGVWTLVLALLLGALQTRRQGERQPLVGSVVLWIAFWVMGVAGLYGFLAHLLFAPFIAEQIGWPNSPFQFEVAYANLTVSILGFSSFYRKRDYLLAAMVAFGSWYFATALVMWCRWWSTTTRHPPMRGACFTPIC